MKTYNTKHKTIEFKNIKIDAYIQKLHNGLEFTPIEISKFKINYHNYISIRISLIKIAMFIYFIWQCKK